MSYGFLKTTLCALCHYSVAWTEAAEIWILMLKKRKGLSLYSIATKHNTFLSVIKTKLIFSHGVVLIFDDLNLMLPTIFFLLSIIYDFI